MSARTMDHIQTLQQIGTGNLMAISGGRWQLVDIIRCEPDLILPVGSGYRVRISLAADDTYTVIREMVRGDKLFAKGEQTGVYADEVGDVAYYASCYKNVDFGAHKVRS